jgi:hypothetical protein
VVIFADSWQPAGEQIATSVAQSISRLESIFRRQLDALVAIETPARAEAVAGTTSDATAVPTYSSSFDVSPAQRAAVAGLGGQATMVLGRLMGLQCAAGQTSWEALETAACAPCPSNGFWEHSRPVHRNTALKLLAFALQVTLFSRSLASRRQSTKYVNVLGYITPLKFGTLYSGRCVIHVSVMSSHRVYDKE